MYAFDYQRAANAADAVAAATGDARYLAGGQSLVQALKLRLSSAEKLIDLAGCAELRGIEVAGGAVAVGAATRHAEVARSADVRKVLPALAELAGAIGDPMVRNMGTLGGSVAHADPAACYPAAVLGLGATVHTDRRTIAADDFFQGMYTTALEPGEILTAVSFPVPEKATYVKFAQPASRFAIVGVFVARTGGAVRVAVTGAAPCVFRARDFEAALTTNWSARSCDGVEVSADGLNSDLHASAGYRAHLIGVLARRAVAQLG
jgi:carbon-monoxide dehydrogenase medium subunit